MSVRIRHCLTVVCDGCGVDATYGDGEFTPHFDSVDQAVAMLRGDGDDEDFTHEWLMTDREHVCPSCRGKRACATVGHDWDEWRGPFDARGVPMLARLCWCCGEREYTPTAGASS